MLDSNLVEATHPPVETSLDTSRMDEKLPALKQSAQTHPMEAIYILGHKQSDLAARPLNNAFDGKLNKAMDAFQEAQALRGLIKNPESRNPNESLVYHLVEWFGLDAESLSQLTPQLIELLKNETESKSAINMVGCISELLPLDLSLQIFTESLASHQQKFTPELAAEIAWETKNSIGNHLRQPGDKLSEAQLQQIDNLFQLVADKGYNRNQNKLPQSSSPNFRIQTALELMAMRFPDQNLMPILEKHALNPITPEAK